MIPIYSLYTIFLNSVVTRSKVVSANSGRILSVRTRGFE